MTWVEVTTGDVSNARWIANTPRSRVLVKGVIRYSQRFTSANFQLHVQHPRILNFMSIRLDIKLVYLIGG